MKLYNKFLSGALALSAGMILFSCSNTDFDYTPAEIPGGDQVYFSSSAASSYTLTSDGSTVNIVVMRGATSQAATVPITVTNASAVEAPSGAFTFPSSVSFAAGENKANYTVQYDASLIDYDTQYSYILTIPEESSFDYGTPSLEISMQIPSPWTRLGNGTYTDEFWGVTATSDVATVSVWQNDNDKNLFRVSNPYVALNGESDSYFEFRLLQPGDTFYGQTVSQEGLVGWGADYFIEHYDYYDDDLYLVFPGRFTSLADPANWVYNYVAAYQDNGLPGEIKLSPYYYMFNVGGWNYTTGETISIVFPGYVVLDYSAEVYYKGLFTNPDNTVEVVANVTLGSDANAAQVAVVAGSDIQSAIAGIEDGSIASVSITKSGDVNIPFDSSNPTGKYSIVVVTYDGDEAQDYASASFNYTNTGYDPNAGWTSLGYVEYTDGYICALWSTGALTYELEIQESEETPGLYRLVNAYGEPYPYNEPGDYDPNLTTYLYVNASDPDRVYIPESESTMDWGYGEMTFYSLAANYLDGGMEPEEIDEKGVWGTLKDGEITFPARALLVFDDDGGYYANVVATEDNSLETDEDGELVAPFLVDLNSLTSAASVQSRSSKMFEHGQKISAQKWMMPNLLFERRPSKANLPQPVVAPLF
ncbi:MAG: hypothetical protein J1E99_07410 [Muribaculaceae bacterium]|nr:hypothetical protein [Muribaculaceae bacterium]